MTMIEKILSSHSDPPREEVKPGDFVVVNVDTVGLYSRPLMGYKFKHIWNPERIWLVDEHNVPCLDSNCAEAHRVNREFAKKYDLRWIEHGRQGICHQMAAEIGFHIPGGIYSCADSHTPSGGGLNCASTGHGPLEMASIIAKGKTWYRCVPTVRFDLSGRIPKRVMARDIILYIGGNWPPFVNMNVEYLGEVADSMSLDGRRCIATASTEIGIDFALFKADEKAFNYVKERTPFPHLVDPVEPDDDADYAGRINLDVSDMNPQVACPHSMSNVKPVTDVEKKGVKIDLAFVGACTGGRIEDIKIASEIVKGRTIHEDVRFIVTPASQEIYLEALKLGYIKTITEAKGLFTVSRCTPCGGGQLGKGEVSITASTRNFKGRMGHPESFVYCASPATVAASALTGYITDPRDV
jgi:3-isopropylmalate/(R)-2-methylmalate dehydratase large subunit